MSSSDEDRPRRARFAVLWLSTIAFTLLFAVWLMLGILQMPIGKSLGFSDTQLDWLVAAAILSGSLLRLNFGIWADRFGGRNVMMFLLLLTAVPTYLFAHATTYPQMLVCAMLFGLAGNGFSVGISWNSAWFPTEGKGTALGVFGAGNVGASGTKLLVLFVPAVLTVVPATGILGGIVPGGWRAIPVLYAALLVVMAGLIFLLAPKNDPRPAQGRPLRELLTPLKSLRVWRFSLYYVVVFGAYVALAGWLPKYYVSTYQVTLHTAALLTASFIFPASLLRPLGGYLADKFGPRIVTYTVFAVMSLSLFLLSIPSGTYAGIKYEPGISLFAGLMLIVGCGMGIGKASVFKYIPNYFPNDVGAVGGVVGMLGALGGFFLPPIFGLLSRSTQTPQSAIVALLVLTITSLMWLHISVARIRVNLRSIEFAPPMAPAKSIPHSETEMAV